MEKQKPRDRIVRALLCAAAACLIAAAFLLILKYSRSAPVFAEFSESDALNGKSDCYLNTLTVLDRYAERSDRESPTQLLLVMYPDRNDRPVVLSLRTESGDPLYAKLSPFWSNEAEQTPTVDISGYFFTEKLSRQGDGAEQAFHTEADAFGEWYAQNVGDAVTQREVVLIWAGETEQAYELAVREKTKGLAAAAIVFASVGVLCALMIPFRIHAVRRRKS